MKQNNAIIVIVALVLVLGVALFVAKSQTSVPRTVSLPAAVPSLISPTPLPAIAGPKVTPWPSPDGTQTLVMKLTTGKDGQKLYDFYVSPSVNGSETLVFSRTVSAGDTMSIPFNSWSPDNQHFFLEQKGTSGEHNLVVNASGKPFPSGEQFEDVNAVFIDKKIPHPFVAATGWAAPTLIVVNTQNPSSSLPISYWFDINHKTFIPLSTSFQ